MPVVVVVVPKGSALQVPAATAVVAVVRSQHLAALASMAAVVVEVVEESMATVKMAGMVALALSLFATLCKLRLRSP